MVQCSFKAAVAVALLAVSVGGCSLIVDFDRRLIDGGVDASSDAAVDSTVDVGEDAAVDVAADAN